MLKTCTGPFWTEHTIWVRSKACTDQNSRSSFFLIYKDRKWGTTTYDNLWRRDSWATEDSDCNLYLKPKCLHIKSSTWGQRRRPWLTNANCSRLHARRCKQASSPLEAGGSRKTDFHSDSIISSLIWPLISYTPHASIITVLCWKRLTVAPRPILRLLSWIVYSIWTM